MAEIIDKIKISNTTYDIKDNISGYVTSSELTEKISGKQDKLISSENIKTINGKSILGSGNIDVMTDQVYDGVLTIEKNSSVIGEFSANQHEDVVINIEVPEKTSDLENDSNFALKSDIPSKISSFTNDSGYMKESEISQIYETKTNVDNKFNAWSAELHSWVESKNYATKSIVDGKLDMEDFNDHVSNTNVHVTQEEKNRWESKSNFDGDYDKLTNKPDLSNYLTRNDVSSVAISGSYSDLLDKPTLVEKSYVDNAINTLNSTKQNKLTPGNNITIIDDVISSTSSTLSAGENITIVNNVINAKDTTYVAGEGISIKNGVISNTGSGGSGGGLAGNWKTEADGNSLSFFMEV